MFGGEGVIDLQQRSNCSSDIPQLGEGYWADFGTEPEVGKTLGGVEILRVEFAQKPDRIDIRGGHADDGAEVDLEDRPAQRRLQSRVR